MNHPITLVLVLFAAASVSAQMPPTAIPPLAQAQAFPSSLPKPLPDSVLAIIKKRYPAIYSPIAKGKKLHGTVVLSVLFNEAGAVEKAETASGDPLLAQCALDFIYKWQIEPFLRNGKPIKVKIPIPFEFIYDDPVSFTTGEVSSQPTGAAVDRVTLAGGSGTVRLVKKVQPEYPAKAKAARVQGTVNFAAVVGKDGAIRELYILSGDQSLAKAAYDAVREWRFKPYIYHGNSVTCDVRIEVNFHLF